MVVTQAGLPIIRAAGGDAGAPERVDLVSRLCLEAPVPARGLVRFRAPVDGDADAIRILRVSPFTIAEPAVAAADLDHVERLHDRVVEPFGGGKV